MAARFSCQPSAKELDSRHLEGVESLSKALASCCVLLERLGAAPVLPDGLVAGNCAALLAPELLLVTRSGKTAGLEPTAADFVVVEAFDQAIWSCSYCGAVRPTSDTPLHWAALVLAPERFRWSQRPAVALHGHALAEKEGLRIAEALQLPISHEETLFSTKEDVEALMKLFETFRCPQLLVCYI